MPGHHIAVETKACHQQEAPAGSDSQIGPPQFTRGDVPGQGGRYCAAAQNAEPPDSRYRPAAP